LFCFVLLEGGCLPFSPYPEATQHWGPFISLAVGSNSHFKQIWGRLVDFSISSIDVVERIPQILVMALQRASSNTAMHQRNPPQTHDQKMVNKRPHFPENTATTATI